MNAQNTARIERLRTAALEPYICYDEFYLNFYRHISASEGSFEARMAQAWAHAFECVEPVIEEDELIVGRAVSRLNDEERAEWKALCEGIVQEYSIYSGQDSHMAVDYELILKEGVRGIIARIEEKLKICDEEKRSFYEACKICLGGVVAYAKKYAQYAEKMAEECADVQRREELLQIAKNCARVPEYPAETFFEAVQAVHFIAHCLSYAPQRPGHMQQFQLGHPDRYLYPYYEKDLREGKITKEDAQMLLDCLAIQINNRVPHGLSSGYMVGGRDGDGKIVANDLTRMGMQVIDDIRLVYPSVGLCWANGMPEDVMEHACEILSHGRSHPAIFNDDLIVSGMMKYGVPETDAREYIHSTCVEITPVAASNVWVASPYTNMLKLLLERMDREYESFDALMEAVIFSLDASILRNFEAENATRKLRAEKSFHPLLSCFVKDCIEEGVDIERGGARYNWIMPSFVGMANLVDSLFALKKLVFEKKEFTIAQLRAAMDADFEGFEVLRLRLLDGIAKYGNDVDEVDELFCGIVQHIIDECRKYTPVLRNARLIPSVFCWIMHEHFGRETGASPDGRHAYFPLGDGSGPCQGREKNGPTAAILSSTKWPHDELIGGVAVNMKFSKKVFNAASGQKVRSLIHAYLDRGGFEMQINVVDRETLLKAQKNPEEYRDLVVRIGGYSDYFVRISPQMQAEILERTAYEV
ncbi:MAG: hypothetical protein E7335_10590 [Clostridiales bacterium]|nr:hypothetical protein [Clostridiales bacterium]